MTLFSVPFFGGWLIGTGFLIESLSLPAALVLYAIVFVDIGFYDLRKAPTRLGRKVMDRIEGFKLYLSVAEKDRMNFHNPPERTPELFEKFLPYALALGVEQAWSEQFDGVLAAASQAPGGSGSGYRPRWYSGNHFHGGRVSDFALRPGRQFLRRHRLVLDSAGFKQRLGRRGFLRRRWRRRRQRLVGAPY